jgi:hypothetical protein
VQRRGLAEGPPTRLKSAWDSTHRRMKQIQITGVRARSIDRAVPMRSDGWIKTNPESPAVSREASEDWARAPALHSFHRPDTRPRVEFLAYTVAYKDFPTLQKPS